MRVLILSILALLVYADSFAQTDSSRIQKIRKTVQQINKDTSNSNVLYETMTLNNGEYLLEQAYVLAT